MLPLVARLLMALASCGHSDMVAAATVFQAAASRFETRSTVERFVLLDAAGHLVAMGAGGASRIDLDEHVRGMLKDADRGLMLIHNHPRGTSLSADDLDTFIHSPGLKSLSVVTAEGMIYTVTAARPTAAAILFDRYSDRKMALRRQMNDRELKGLSHRILVEMDREGLVRYTSTRLQ